MLSKYFNLDNVKIMSKNEFNLYPKASDRNWWENISPELKNQLISSGEKYLNFQYPILTPSQFMKFEKEGERPPYEEPYAQRRDALNALVLAECAEHKGRFIDDIINGIYLICDETSWVVPAHNYKDIRFGTHDGNNTALLPVDDNIVIELRSTKTGQDLATVYYLLKDELDVVSPVICQRIEKKIEERVVSLYEKYDDYFWKRETNNWNPQCNIHCLVASMIMIDDDERRKNFVQKVLKSTNYYISAFPNDGGCDEGVLYWAHSCANLFRIADFIKQITYEKIDITKEPKIIAMANFPTNMYICNGRVINYADCTSFGLPGFEILYNFGKAAKSDSAMALSKIAKKSKSTCTSIEDVIAYGEVDKLNCEYKSNKEIYYPDLQVVVLKEQTQSGEIVFSAKGGHNNESHNHCDVGNFVIYKNGNPVVIDPGTDQYVAASFTSKRYEIWYNNSLHHNLPVIDGIMQKNGPRYDGVVMDETKLVAPAFEAADVDYKNDRFSLDIAPCYGSDKVKKWKRNFYFDRENNKIEISEDYELLSEGKIDLVFMVTQKPEITDECILLSEGVKLCIENVTASFEEITDISSKMVHQWGKVYRLTLSTKGKSGTIKYSFEL
ncbi:MAG: heparinase II/III family protein [Clostridia bacterium]|nr:heparinase II/III family protein [Clostridia bacterium]